MDNDTRIYSSMLASELSGLSAETASRITETPMPTSQNVANLTPLELVGQDRLPAVDVGRSDTAIQQMPLIGKDPSTKGRG